MPEQEVTNFVCVHCWKAFTFPRDGIGVGQESVVCPHCGEDVPIPPDDDLGLEGADETSQVSALVGGELTTDNAIAAPAPAEPPPPMDPETVVWKLLIPGGLTYNFHGLAALRRWSAGKRNLQEVAVSLDGIVWRNFGRFSQLVADGHSAEEALQEAGPAFNEAAEDDAAAGPQPMHTHLDLPIADDEPPTAVAGQPGEAAPTTEQPKLQDLGSARDLLGEMARREGGGPPPPPGRDTGAMRTVETEELAPLESSSTEPPPAPPVAAARAPTGQFKFNVEPVKADDTRDRIVYMAIGVGFGLGLGVLLHVLGIWAMIIP